MKRKACHYIQSPAEWMLLMSPVRVEILEAIRLIGPCTIAEAAVVLDRPPDTLYRHVELLQQAGAVQEAGFRKGARNVEQLVDVVADDFAVDFHDATGRAENQAMVATVNSFSKAMVRAVRDSATARQLEFQADRRNLAINYELSWLTPEAFQKLRGLVAQIKQLMDDGKKQRQGRLYLSLVVATPVTRRRGAANSRSGKK